MSVVRPEREHESCKPHKTLWSLFGGNDHFFLTFSFLTSYIWYWKPYVPHMWRTEWNYFYNIDTDMGTIYNQSVEHISHLHGLGFLKFLQNVSTFLVVIYK